jgi:hypothetical protein
MQFSNEHDITQILLSVLKRTLPHVGPRESVEVELKIGIIVNSQDCGRIFLPCCNPILLLELPPHFRFASEISVEHHMACNLWFNELYVSHRRQGESFDYRHSKTTDYFYEGPSGSKIRKSWDSSNSEHHSTIIKKKVKDCHIHYPNGIYDVRISVSVEESLEDIESALSSSYKRIKDRVAYIFPKKYSIDLTQVTTSNSKIHELEIEIDPSSLSLQNLDIVLCLVDHLQAKIFNK